MRAVPIAMTAIGHTSRIGVKAGARRTTAAVRNAFTITPGPAPAN